MSGILEQRAGLSAGLLGNRGPSGNYTPSNCPPMNYPATRYATDKSSADAAIADAVMSSLENEVIEYTGIIDQTSLNYTNVIGSRSNVAYNPNRKKNVLFRPPLGTRIFADYIRHEAAQVTIANFDYRYSIQTRMSNAIAASYWRVVGISSQSSITMAAPNMHLDEFVLAQRGYNARGDRMDLSAIGTENIGGTVIDGSYLQPGLRFISGSYPIVSKYLFTLSKNFTYTRTINDADISAGNNTLGAFGVGFPGVVLPQNSLSATVSVNGVSKGTATVNAARLPDYILATLTTTTLVSGDVITVKFTCTDDIVGIQGMLWVGAFNENHCDTLQVYSSGNGGQSYDLLIRNTVMDGSTNSCIYGGGGDYYGDMVFINNWIGHDANYGVGLRYPRNHAIGCTFSKPPTVSGTSTTPLYYLTFRGNKVPYIPTGNIFIDKTLNEVDVNMDKNMPALPDLSTIWAEAPFTRSLEIAA